MILFTGHGSLHEAFSRRYDCEVVSARKLSDKDLTDALRSAAVVVHNAASLGNEGLAESVENNFLLTKRVIDLLHAVNRESRFIYVGSMSYLQDDRHYLPFDQMTSYAYSKYLGETYCLLHAHQPMLSVRFSTIFYGDPAKDGLSKLVHDAKSRQQITLINEGVACRDFLPVNIAADYLYRFADLSISFAKKQVVNIASGTKHSFSAVAGYLTELIPALQVDHVNSNNSTPVLCDFSIDGLKEVGVIDFSLKDSIKDYWTLLP